jgi:glucosyl-3-phosphoglycerate synthase
MCNELNFNRHEEEVNVDLLCDIILSGGRKYLQKPISAQLPDWLRAVAAMPDIRERLREEAIDS